MDTDTQALYESIHPRYPELAGQVAIITGSSRGIGRGIAIRLAREGMRVVINSRSPEPVEQLTVELRALGVEALAVPADVGRAEEVTRLFKETMRAFGTVDLLVNNAASLRRVRLLDLDETLLDTQLAANIKGPFLCSYHAARIMREHGGGNIIHISSVGGARAHWVGLPYDATKGALDALTRTMALDLAEYGIRVNAVAPGATVPEDRTWIISKQISRIPLGRVGRTLEMGAAVAFLASPDASYITGQVLYVDGGITIQLGTREQPT